MYSGNHGNGSANHVPFPHSSPPNSAHDILDGNNQDSAITPPPAGGGGGKPAHRPSLPLPMKGMMHKMRVSSIDNEDDQTQLDVKALDADALAGRIGELFQKLLEIEVREDVGVMLYVLSYGCRFHYSTTDVLESPSLLPSCSIITISLLITIILTIPRLSFCLSTSTTLAGERWQH